MADLAEVMHRCGLAIDLGAGFGMHAVPLARAGWRVVAVDASPILLAELAILSEGLPVASHCGNLLASIKRSLPTTEHDLGSAWETRSRFLKAGIRSPCQRSEEIGPRMLARLAKHTGITPEDLWYFWHPLCRPTRRSSGLPMITLRPRCYPSPRSSSNTVQ